MTAGAVTGRKDTCIMNQRHGGDIYHHQVTYDFSISVNPLGMPAGSIRAAQEGVLRACAYPDLLGDRLRETIAEREGVCAGHIVLGNGASELIYALCHALRPHKTMVTTPSFSEYETAARSSNSDMAYYDLKEEDGFHMDETVLSQITEDISLFFLCNPNNPTGTVTEKALLLQIAKRCEQTGTFLCVDECFLPSHLIVLRAFTKIYAMAGLRLGYAMTANEDLLGLLGEVLPPWNTSLPAQMAGIAAMQDADYLEKTRVFLAGEKRFLRRELSDGLAGRIYASKADYLFFHSRPDLRERLLERGILIRSCSDYRNLSPGFFRIGVRTHEENVKLIEAWRDCFPEEERATAQYRSRMNM